MGCRYHRRNAAGGDLKLRFGMVAALQKKFITIKQLLKAMNVQLQEDAERMPHRRVGEILVSLGYINPHQVDEVLAEMGVQS